MKLKNTLIKSLVISLMLGVTFSLLINILSATYFEKDGALGTQMVLTGIDAVSASIREFGLASFIRMFIGYFIVFFLAVLIGCLWLNKWQSSESKH